MRKQYSIIVLFVLLTFTVDSRGEPAALIGTVNHVRDGDTFEISSIPIRIAGISAPELNQELGLEAQKFLKKLILGETIKCELNGQKSYDRLVGKCYLHNIDLGKAIIIAGLALDCPKYSKGYYSKYESKKAQKIITFPKYCKMPK